MNARGPYRDNFHLARMALLAEQARKRVATAKIAQNIASLDDFAVGYADSALGIRDCWAATVRVARARRDLGLGLGVDFDCVFGASRGRHIPTTYRTVSWIRVPGHALSYPPDECLPDDLVAKIEEIDLLISTPADELDDLLRDFGLDPTEMAHAEPDARPDGLDLPPPPRSLRAPHILKEQAAMARLVIGPEQGQLARDAVWDRVDKLVTRDCDPEVWFNQGLVNWEAYYSLWFHENGEPFPIGEAKLVTPYEVVEEVMRSQTDLWRAAEADICGHRVLPDP